MFKKPFNKRFQEATQSLREDWRKALGYFFIALTFGIAFVWATLHGINNELATHWFFKAYLFSFITGMAMWLFFKDEAKSAEKARQAARQAAKSRNASEAEVAKLSSKLAKARAEIAELEQQVIDLTEWNERSQRANQSLSRDLKTAKNTIARLSAPTKVVSVKISSNTAKPETEGKNTTATPTEDVSEIDAVFGLMQRN